MVRRLQLLDALPLHLRAGSDERRLPVTLVWQIHEGHFGDVRLDGLGVVALGEFAGNMWVDDPDATMAAMFYIDAKGTPAQRDALEEIFRGNAGGWPGTFGSLISDVRSVQYAPIHFDAAPDLAYWRATVSDKVSVGATALTGPTSDPNAGAVDQRPRGGGGARPGRDIGVW